MRTEGKEGIIRLTGEDLAELRHACFIRDGGRCVDCGVMLREFPQNPFIPWGYQMAHRRNKRMYGDTLENVVSKCRRCHLDIEHAGHGNGKVVPRK